MNSVSEGLLPGRLDLFWGRFRISSRLAALLLLPLLGFICAMSIAVEEAWQTERRMADVANLAEVAGAVGNLVTGLQQEAGASAAFVTSKGTQKGEALPTLRTISDKAVAAVESAVTAADFDRTGGQAVLALRQVQQALEQLGAKRGFERVDLPRYYVPLTGLGRVAIGLGLHRRIADYVPASLTAKLVELRAAWYNRKLRSLTEAS